VRCFNQPGEGSILFTGRAVKLHFSYQRFIENQIRHAFGFMGTPIWIKNRARD
jgi:GTPase